MRGGERTIMIDKDHMTRHDRPGTDIPKGE